MRKTKLILGAGIVVAVSIYLFSCQKYDFDQSQSDYDKMARKGGGETSVGNNLSFPVIWAEGQSLTLRTPPAGTPADSVKLAGAWWYVWGTEPVDPQSTIYSCQPNPSNELTCLDGTDPGDGSTVYKAFLQNDANNYWRAYNAAASSTVYVDSIDWGDNLESIDWSLTSKVRTEVVITDNLSTPVLQYAMRHVSGWGTDEMHGLQTTLNNAIQYGPGNIATVFTKHARLTIQKLTSETPSLQWDATNHYWTGDANSPVYNMPVWAAGDGPSYFNAEVNIKGKVIYGYNWDLKKLNDGAGVYRITFSFDSGTTGSGTALNTYFDQYTGLIMPSETEEGAGGVPVLDVTDNLTYIDVTITGHGGGGGGKGSGGHGSGH